MALQSFTVSIGALRDVNNNDKNYVSGEAIYVKTIGGTFAPIFRDLAGTSEIAQDGLANQTNEKGQFTFFVEAGDYILEYQNQSTPVTIVGADYFNNRVEETVNQIIIDTATSRGFRVVGDFASGFTYELPNDVAIDGSGNYWVYADVNALPFVVTAGATPSAPTYTQVTFNQASGVTTTAGINAQQFIDNFELKIFQSPTDNLTKVSTFAGGVGVVYEVRKVSDNSLATIYSDAAGTTEIAQNGTANVSGSDGIIEFYIADGDYYVEVGFVKSNFNTVISSDKVAFKLPGVASAVAMNLTKKLSDFGVSVAEFGAVGDGVNDDSPAIQMAIDYVHSQGGGTIFFPKPSNYYRLASTRTTTTNVEACLILPAPTATYGDPIKLEGAVPNTAIRVDTATDVHSALYFEGTSLYKQMENIDIWGGLDPNNPKVDYVLYGADGYHSNTKFDTSRFYGAKIECFRMATFVSTWSNLQTAYAPIGFKIAGPDEFNDVTTSLTMNSCYALNHNVNGFWFGNTTYCSLISCASDHVDGFPYRFGIARGVTMSACGAESSPRILKILTAQGFSLLNFYTLSIGDDITPPEALIDIEGGTSSVLQGLHLQNSKSYDYKVKLGTTFASESVTIPDSSIAPQQVAFVPNYAHSNPFKFLVWEKSTRNFTWPITTVQSLVDTLKSFDNSYQNHVQTLQFPDGDFTLTQPIQALIAMVNGAGSIVFKGGVNSRIVAEGANQMTFGDTPTTLNVVFKDIDLHMGALSGVSQGFIFNGRNTEFINSNITSYNAYVQYAISGKANLFFDSNSEALTAFAALGDKYSVTLAPRASTPSATYPNRSIAYKDNPDGVTRGWVRGSGGWFSFN